ncbi:MAG: cupin domain-containing protein [Saprospiraceae bacterium]|nr:cupin domain-containing protein [Saprospiraceae bacterium]
MKNVFKLLALIFIFGLSSNLSELKSQDVLKAAPNVYKLLSDTLGMRLFEIEFEPGEAAALHTHPDHAVYVVTGGTLEVAHANGHKEIVKLESGMGVIFPSESHSAKNIGNTSIKAVVVEVMRKRYRILIILIYLYEKCELSFSAFCNSGANKLCSEKC